MEMVGGWHGGVVVVVAAESEFCTTLIWVTYLIGWLGIRFRVARKVISQRLPRTNCFGLTRLQRKLHPVALAVAVPESTFQPGGLRMGVVG